MTISELDQILVTGATGFIGGHCVGELLNRNYRVKAAVRSLKKFDQLKAGCPSDKQHLLSHVIISDITSVEELVDGVKGCTGVLHLASPYTYSVNDFVEDLLHPAMNGTLSILKAAKQEPTIKRVVITSSFAAVFDATKGMQSGVVLSESSFSPLTFEDGANTKDPAVAYRASKIVAERAAWDFVEQENPSFDISILCPPMVFGPVFAPQLVYSIEDLNFSNQAIWNIIQTKSSDPVPPTKGFIWVDVRDLAFAHAEALFHPKASNQRFIISAGDFDNQEIADILRDSLDSKVVNSNVPIGNPGERLAGTHFTTDATKSIKELGVTYRKLDDCVTSLAHQLLAISNKL